MEMPSIEDFIVHQQCPIVDGIVFPNGQIQLIDVSVSWKPTLNFKFEIGTKSSILELEGKGELDWSDCSFLAKKTYNEEELTLFAGEGVWGSDGFIGCINSMSQKLLWVAYFTESNPFYEVAFRDGSVYAKSTLEIWWEFPINEPFLVRTMDESSIKS